MKKLLLASCLLLAGLVPAKADALPKRSIAERPTYRPSWERSQRRYLPSYQYDLERRKVCGNMCDDFPSRRHRDE